MSARRYVSWSGTAARCTAVSTCNRVWRGRRLARQRALAAAHYGLGYWALRSPVAASLTASEARLCAQMKCRAVGVGRLTAVHTPISASWTICQLAPY